MITATRRPSPSQPALTLFERVGDTLQGNSYPISGRNALAVGDAGELIGVPTDYHDR
jgi:hypothetical protein